MVFYVSTLEWTRTDTRNEFEVVERLAARINVLGEESLRHLAMLALSALPLSATSAIADPERIEGVAVVVDGDTLDIESAGERIRLYGIDAPERGQTCDSARRKQYPCGHEAAAYLAQIIGRSGRVTCAWSERDEYRRPVAECLTLHKAVLNAEMVKAGWAIVFRRYSDGRYDQDEAEAKEAKRGLWAGTFIEPAAWRRAGRLARERVAAGQPEGCPIKGNISGSNRIYHSPGQENYSKTKIDVSAGERWFCSAEEAEAAGWRPAKR